MQKSYELNADGKTLLEFRETLRPLIVDAGFDDQGQHEILLAVQEVLTNIVRYTYGENAETVGKILFDFQEDADRIKISIRDFGAKFDLTQMPDPKLPREEPGGLGVFLVKQMMDEVIYDNTCEDGNLLHLIKLKKATENS